MIRDLTQGTYEMNIVKSLEEASLSIRSMITAARKDAGVPTGLGSAVSEGTHMDESVLILLSYQGHATKYTYLSLSKLAVATQRELFCAKTKGTKGAKQVAFNKIG